MIKNFLNRCDSTINAEEEQYLNLIRDILTKGSLEQGRNGNTCSIFGSAMHFSLEKNKIPIITTKKIAWKTCFKELLWFIRGSTDNKELKKAGVNIWNGNATRKFLDSRGLTKREEDDLGPIYGFQWRHFNAPYANSESDYSGKGIDQLQMIIDELKDPERRNSRRLVMTAWNPCQINEMALPPCHVMAQFNVSRDNKLSCCMFQRSGDVGLGVPFNIASYSLLTHLLAKHCDLEAYEFVYFLGNAHIYDQHVEMLYKQTSRKPFDFPTIEIKEKRKNIEDYTMDDIEIINYECYEPIKMEMIV
jgi:thymidylate synthase